MTTFRSRDPELQLCVTALALRFMETSKVNEPDALIKVYAEDARKIVMKRVSEGPVELSTLQSLCLLSLVDFTCNPIALCATWH